MMVKFIINYLWHDADACSQIAKSVLKVLSSDGTCDGGHPGFFFFSRRGLSIAVLHSFVSYTTSVVGRTHLLPRISLRYLAYVGTFIVSRSGMLP